MNEADLKKLNELRHALLQLHKALLDTQRNLYEKKHGRVRKEVELFKLVTEHRSFAWLSPLSMLIVSIDETLEADFVHPKEILSLQMRIKTLVKPSHTGIEFAKKLERALQASPDVVLALGEVSQLLKEKGSA